MKQKIEKNTFGGKNAEQYNILMQAFKDCAEEEEMEFYDWLDITPKTTMVVFLVDKLNQLGYKIKE